MCVESGYSLQYITIQEVYLYSSKVWRNHKIFFVWLKV